MRLPYGIPLCVGFLGYLWYSFLVAAYVADGSVAATRVSESPNSGPPPRACPHGPAGQAAKVRHVPARPEKLKDPARPGRIIQRGNRTATGR